MSSLQALAYTNDYIPSLCLLEIFLAHDQHEQVARYFDICYIEIGENYEKKIFLLFVPEGFSPTGSFPGLQPGYSTLAGPAATHVSNSWNCFISG